MANLQVIHKSKFCSSYKQDKSIFEFTKNNVQELELILAYMKQGI